MPPAPSGDRTSYGPSRVPTESGMGSAVYFLPVAVGPHPHRGLTATPHRRAAWPQAPIPPAPRAPTTSYGPRRVPAASATEVPRFYWRRSRGSRRSDLDQVVRRREVVV